VYFLVLVFISVIVSSYLYSSSVVYIEHASNANVIFLPLDTSLKDGLFHEFKKHGKVTSVQIHGATEDRYGLVFFRQQEDQEKALTVSKGKLFFGMLIEVTAWNGPGALSHFFSLKWGETRFWGRNVTFTSSLLIDPFILFRNRE
jgi:hypothetical protein